MPYTDSGDRKRCFYVDFIILLKNGTICLFDTKTCNSDEDAPEKNNALYEYCKEYCEKGKKVIGGVLIAQGNNWYYPDGIIDDTDSIAGWSVLELGSV